MKPRILIPMLLVVLVVVVIALDAQRRQTKAELREVSVQLDQLKGGNTAANQQRAKEVLEKVKLHMDLDTSVEPTVATIIDVEKLKAQNPFYNKAKNGDFLIVTTSRAVLYDAGADVILDVIPVQLDEAPADTSAR